MISSFYPYFSTKIDSFALLFSLFIIVYKCTQMKETIPGGYIALLKIT